MKAKLLLLPIITAAFTSSVLADTTTIDTATTVNAADDITKTSVTIAAGDDWKIVSGGSYYHNNNTSGFNFDFNINGTLETSATGGSVLRFDARGSDSSGATTNINISGGTINNNSGGGTTYIFGQDANQGKLNINLANGASIKNTSGTLTLEIARNTYTVVNVDATSSISATNIDYATRPRNVSGGIKQEFNVNGGTVNLTGNLNIANDGRLSSAGSGLDATFNVTKGGTVTTNNLYMNYNAGAGAVGQQANKSYLTVKDSGSKLIVNNGLYIGVVTVSNSDTIGELILYTGTQTTVGGTTTLRNYGKIRAVLDSSNLSASAPLFTTANATLTSGDTSAFIIDGSALSSAFSDATVLLFQFTSGSITLNGTSYTIADLAALDISNPTDFAILADFIAFENNTGNQYWEDFGYDNLIFDSATNSISLSLELIPEPATYAALFGALAIAFAAYRRKRA